MTFGPLVHENLERAAQLTERTSQMNACKRPITAATLGAHCGVVEDKDGVERQEQEPRATGICVAVRDRFGTFNCVILHVDSLPPRHPLPPITLSSLSLMLENPLHTHKHTHTFIPFTNMPANRFRDACAMCVRLDCRIRGSRGGRAARGVKHHRICRPRG